MRTESLLAGSIAVELGIVNQAQVETCLKDQEARLDPKPLGEVLLQRGLITATQLQQLLAEQRRRLEAIAETRLFGQVALAKGFITPAQLAECVREQMRGVGPKLATDRKRPLLGQLLYKKGYLSRTQFREIIAAQGKALYQCPKCKGYSVYPAHASLARTVCASCRTPLVSVSVEEKGRSRDEGKNDTTIIIKAPLANLGKFELQGEIARGSMGIVFKAHDRTLDRVVALKVLKEGDSNVSFIRRLHREAALAAKLRHENIVTVHEVGETDGLHYLCMDFIEGTELVEFIRRKKLRPRLWLRLIEKVARAVHYAHTQGIIHRDLKPSNILVTDAGVPYIMDFGLAKQLDDAAWLTKEGTAMGTPYYMPPEQILGKLERIDQRSDVYSLGVILYEIMAGMPPYTGRTSMEIYQRALVEDPVRPSALAPNLEPDLEAICLKAMEKEPNHRYATAEDLAFDIGRHLSGEPVMAARATSVRMAMRRVRRHAWKAATLLGACLLTILIVIIITRVNRSRRIEELEHQAQQHYDQHRWEDAQVAYVRLLSEDPHNVMAHQRLGELKLRLEQEKVTAAKTAVQEFSEERQRRQAAAKPYFTAGTAKMEDARAMMHQEGIELRSVDTRLREAAAEFTKAIDRDVDYVDAYYLRGRCLLDLGDYAAAESDFTRVIDLAPGHPAAHLERGKLYFVKTVQHVEGRFKGSSRTLHITRSVRAEADEYKARAIADFTAATDNAAAEDRFLMAAFMCLAEGDTIQAVINFMRTLAQNPVNVDALFGRGFCHVLRGEYELAIDFLKRAVKLKPNLYAGYTALGLAHAARGDLEGAIPFFERVRAIGDRQAMSNLAALYAVLGRHEEALEAYEVLRGLPNAEESDRRRVELARASVLFAKGDLKAAVETAERLIEAYPQWMEPYELAAVCHAQNGALQLAEGYLQRAIKIEPENVSLLANFAALLLEMERVDEAFEMAARALKIEPNSSHARIVRGSVYARRGQMREALAEFDLAVEVAPWDARAHLNRALALLELDRPEEALVAAQKARDVDRSEATKAERIIAEAQRRIRN